MISRRNFLKLAGVSTLAVGSGYLTGKLTQTSKRVSYSIYGFIPEDETVVINILTAFKNKVRSSSKAVVLYDSKFGEVLTRFNSELINSNYIDRGKITYTLRKLSKSIDSDIIISDKDNSIYSLDNFNFTFTKLRNDLAGREANHILSAEYCELDFFSTLMAGSSKEVIIENEKGIVERFSLEKNYKNVLVEGVQGKTGLEINNGFVQVHTSTCRNEICKHTIANNIGDIIACAPNKVLVRIVWEPMQRLLVKALVWHHEWREEILILRKWRLLHFP